MEGTPTARSTRSTKFWVVSAALVLGIVFIAVNWEETTINFIVAKAEAPLVVALLITGFLGFVIGLALPRLRSPRE